MYNLCLCVCIPEMVHCVCLCVEQVDQQSCALIVNSDSDELSVDLNIVSVTVMHDAHFFFLSPSSLHYSS